MTTAERERVQSLGRKRMRQKILERQAAGIPLFTEQQVSVLHQQLRDRKAS